MKAKDTNWEILMEKQVRRGEETCTENVCMGSGRLAVQDASMRCRHRGVRHVEVVKMSSGPLPSSWDSLWLWQESGEDFGPQNAGLSCNFPGEVLDSS